jgi:hypothetical protein
MRCTSTAAQTFAPSILGDFEAWFAWCLAKYERRHRRYVLTAIHVDSGSTVRLAATTTNFASQGHEWSVECVTGNEATAWA